MPRCRASARPGPTASKGGFDIIAQGMSGIMMMTGYPGGRPAKVGIAMNDIASGVTALYGILGAYIGRLRNGTGQYLETSLLEAGLAWSIWEFGAFFGGGEIPTATGTRHRRSAPYQAYRSKDGYVTVGAGSDKLWRNFCTMVCEKPEWLTDPRFATLVAAAVRNVDELEQEIEKVLGTQPTAHWVEQAGRGPGPRGAGLRLRADPERSAHQGAPDGGRHRPPEDRPDEDAGPADQVDRRADGDPPAGALAGPAFGRGAARHGLRRSRSEGACSRTASCSTATAPPPASSPDRRHSFNRSRHDAIENRTR